MSNNYLKECKQQMKQLRHINTEKFWKNYIYKDTAMCNKTPYHGLVMDKMPCDMFIYMDMFYRFKPDTIIEIGTANGGSSYFFKDTSNAKIITIDIHHCSNKKEGIVYIQGDATDPKIFDRVKEVAEGNNIWIVDDGSHMITDVVDCFDMYSELVSDNGFYIIEDGMSGLLFKDHPNRQPCIAIQKILYENKNFKLFTEYDQFILTAMLRGILREKTN